MINFKWGFLAAVVSFIVSFGVGLVFGVNIFHVILRAFIFAAVFFGVGFGLCFVVNNFFPELLGGDTRYEGTETNEQLPPGSRINITMDTAGEYAVPELFKTPGAPDELGNINDLVSGQVKPRSKDVDRMKEESYNQEMDFDDHEDFPNTGNFSGIHEAERSISPDMPDSDGHKVEKQAFNLSFGESDGLGGLPDLDAMAMAFSQVGGHSTGSHSSEGFSSAGSHDDVLGFDSSDSDMDFEEPRSTGNKPKKMKGDFNPKELAEGIRTVLIKDK